MTFVQQVKATNLIKAGHSCLAAHTTPQRSVDHGLILKIICVLCLLGSQLHKFVIIRHQFTNCTAVH